MPKLPFDTLRDFVAVGQAVSSPNLLVAHPSIPVRSVRELVQLAKAKPGALSYGAASIGSTNHLAAELFKSKAGIEMVHVPYKSGAEMVTSILSEQTQVAFPDISILLPLIREKKLKALAVTSARRNAQLPDVPTMIESGIPDFVLTFWTGIIAPAGTPAAAVSALNSAVVNGLKTESVRETLARVGAEATPGTPQEFGAFIASEAQKWASVARTAGIQPE